MKQRLNLLEKGSNVMKPMIGIKKYLDQSAIDSQNFILDVKTILMKNKNSNR